MLLNPSTDFLKFQLLYSSVPEFHFGFFFKFLFLCYFCFVYTLFLWFCSVVSFCSLIAHWAALRWLYLFACQVTHRSPFLGAVFGFIWLDLFDLFAWHLFDWIMFSCFMCSELLFLFYIFAVFLLIWKTTITAVSPPVFIDQHPTGKNLYQSVQPVILTTSQTFSEDVSSLGLCV